MHHGTCVTHMPCCMPGSLTSGFLWSRWRGKRPCIPGACAIHNFLYLVRGPWNTVMVQEYLRFGHKEQIKKSRHDNKGLIGQHGVHCFPGHVFFVKRGEEPIKPENRRRGYHDDVIKWKHFPRYWPFVRRTHRRSPVNSPHKGQWCGALMFSLIYVWTSGWANNRDAGDLRRHHTHYDATIMHL